MVTLERPTVPTVRYPLARVNYGAAEIAAVTACLESGWTTCGPRVASFEVNFAQFVGRSHAVMVNSGSSADLLLAYSLGTARDGEEILVPAVTWPTQVWSCIQAGYTVRLVDVDPDTLQWNLDDLVSKITSKTRALFTTHVLGNVGDLDRLCQVASTHGLPLLEDCCEALGSRWRGRHVGTFGAGGAFSFFFSHLLTTMEGGMVVLDSATVERTIRLWRNHGWEPVADAYCTFPTWGMNLRPTEVQGAFGQVQLSRITSFIAARHRNFARLHDAIASYPTLLRTAVKLTRASVCWHAFPIVLTRDAPFDMQTLCLFLGQRGIETRPIIAGNLARHPFLASHPTVLCGPLPGADLLHDRSFYIGLPSVDDEAGIASVEEALGDFMKAHT